MGLQPRQHVVPLASDQVEVTLRVGDPTRLALLEHLSDRGPASITMLADRFTAMTRQGVTKHLHVLAAAGVIVAFHNTWSGIHAVLTLVGWCLIIKSLIRFCAPKLALRMMSRVSVERSWEFQVAGVALVALGGLIGYGLYFG